MNCRQIFADFFACRFTAKDSLADKVFWELNKRNSYFPAPNGVISLLLLFFWQVVHDEIRQTFCM